MAEAVISETSIPTTTAAITPEGDGTVTKAGDVVSVDFSALDASSACTGVRPLTTVSDGYLAGACKQGVFAFDMNGLRKSLDAPLAPELEIVNWKVGGGVLAVLTHENVPQTGLEPARLVVRVHAFDLASGQQRWAVEPTVPAAKNADFSKGYESDLEVIGVSSKGVVLVDSTTLYACGARIPGAAVALGEGGNPVWRTERIWSSSGNIANAGTGNYRPDCGDKTAYREKIVDSSTGGTIVQGGSYDLREPVPCSPWVQSRKKEYSTDPPDQYTNITTGKVINVTAGSYKGLLREGILVSGPDDSLVLVNGNGRKVWSLPANVTSDWSEVSGQLVVTDGTGAHLLINQATGQVDRQVDLPEGLDDFGRWQTVTADGDTGWKQADPLWTCLGTV